MEMQDQRLLEGIRRARSRAHNLELDDAMAERLRDMAVELLQVGLVNFEAALHREEFEGVEAGEHHEQLHGHQDALARAIGRVYAQLEQHASDPATVDRVGQFIDAHPPTGLIYETSRSLTDAIIHIKALATDVLDDPSSLLSNVDVAVDDLRQARVDFERENSEFVDAQRELAAAREVVYVGVLNARDVLRAALRLLDRLEELDGLLPPLGDLLGSA